MYLKGELLIAALVWLVNFLKILFSSTFFYV